MIDIDAKRSGNEMNTNGEPTKHAEDDILNSVSNWENYKKGVAQLPSHNRTPLTGMNVNLNPIPRDTNRPRKENANHSNQTNGEPTSLDKPPLRRTPSVVGVHRNTSIRSNSSTQRLASTPQTDFTSKQELKKFKEKKRFIFHRGFFKRNSNKKKPVIGTSISQQPNRRATNKRYRTRTELEAVLNYADIRSLHTDEIFPESRDNLTRIYRPVLKYHYRPRIEPTTDSLPISQYNRAPNVTRTSSIKRPIPSVQAHEKNILKPKEQPPLVTIPSVNTVELQSDTPQRALRRSKTSPGGYRNLRQRNMSPERRIIHALWRKYMMCVIYERVNLRMSLLTAALTSDDSLSSDTDNELEEYEDEKENPLASSRPTMINDSSTMSRLSSYKVTPTSVLSVDDQIVAPEETELDHLLDHASAMPSSRLHLIETPLDHVSTHSMTTSKTTSK